jgi:hypothetical protein
MGSWLPAQLGPRPAHGSACARAAQPAYPARVGPTAAPSPATAPAQQPAQRSLAPRSAQHDSAQTPPTRADDRWPPPVISHLFPPASPVFFPRHPLPW